MIKIRKHPKFSNIFVSGSPNRLRIYTKNRDLNKTVYGEKIVEYRNSQYREWNPYRSKICASIMNKAHNLHITPDTNILYLGAASGTTVSHLSDILSGKGKIFAVEFSPRSLRELVQNCIDRENVIPILGDANKPFEFSHFISGRINIIIQDVAQPNQTDILIKNARRFLSSNQGFFIYAIKARSIDTFADPNQIFNQEIEKLNKSKLKTENTINISNYQEDHVVLFGKML